MNNSIKPLIVVFKMFKKKRPQNNKKQVEQKIRLNLFGENDMNIYIFNRIGILLGLSMTLYIAVYFYL